MNKTRYFLIGMLALVAILIIAAAPSSSASTTNTAQQFVGVKGQHVAAYSAAAPKIDADSISDYYERHEVEDMYVEKAVDLSSDDFYLRHLTEFGALRSLDTTDFYVRHPELLGLQVGLESIDSPDTWATPWDIREQGYLLPVTGGLTNLDAMKFRSYKSYPVSLTGDLALYAGDDWFNKGYPVVVAVKYGPPGR